MALLICLIYLLIGILTNENQLWAQVNLPLSGISLLFLGLAATEAYLYVQRVQRNQEDLFSARARELELIQRLAFQRQSTLNEISRKLIDELDVNKIPQDVLEKTAQLFEADVVGVWVNEKSPFNFVLRGLSGLTAFKMHELTEFDWKFPQFDHSDTESRQIVFEDIRKDCAGSFTTFCEKERIVCGVLSPIVRREERVGCVVVCYRKPPKFNPSLTAEMQTVANLVASAIQAEELYYDLIQVQKTESIGSLSSGIAHDFNNVLAAILACATYIKQQSDPSSPIYKYLEATEASAHRGAALTKQLLAFVRREGPKLSVVDVHTQIEHTLKMVGRSFDKSILLQRQFAPELHPIEIDASQFEQIILNVAVNARDAMPNGGIFTIATRNIRLMSNDPYRPTLPLPDGNYVVLGFRDTGHGMDEATLKRVFEPFFTTKGRGKGTGLGLAMVQNIVQTFGGDIHVESSLGKGTLFEIYLPATTKPLPQPTTPDARSSKGGRECILLAEDEEVIREMAQLSLEAKGYKVLPAIDGANALNIYRKHSQQIALVIADLDMPLMSGSELFAQIKDINPNVRVIVSSGYSHDQEGQRMLKHGCLGYLQKPYNPDTLNQLVRSVLDSGL